MTVNELIKELTDNFEPNDCVRIDGDCLRISSEVCDSVIEIGRSGDGRK
jgi:spore coat polysaccharide biosynthesis protein SpsF (cytidylyltransferase family)